MYLLSHPQHAHVLVVVACGFQLELLLKDFGVLSHTLYLFDFDFDCLRS